MLEGVQAREIQKMYKLWNNFTGFILYAHAQVYHKQFKNYILNRKKV